MPYDFSRLAVLVLEESPLMRELMRTILREMQIRDVTEVSRIDAAYNELQHKLHDVAFIDWSPECDGLELVKRVRREKGSASPMIPIIIVSAFTEMGQVAAARDAGADAFLAKPFSARDIYDHLAGVVESSRVFVRGGAYNGPDRRRRRKTSYRGEERRKPRPAPPENAAPAA